MILITGTTLSLVHCISMCLLACLSLPSDSLSLSLSLSLYLSISLCLSPPISLSRIVSSPLYLPLNCGALSRNFSRLQYLHFPDQCLPTSADTSKIRLWFCSQENPILLTQLSRQSKFKLCRSNYWSWKVLFSRTYSSVHPPCETDDLIATV